MIASFMPNPEVQDNETSLQIKYFDNTIDIKDAIGVESQIKIRFTIFLKRYLQLFIGDEKLKTIDIIQKVFESRKTFPNNDLRVLITKVQEVGECILKWHDFFEINEIILYKLVKILSRNDLISSTGHDQLASMLSNSLDYKPNLKLCTRIMIRT